MIYAACFKIHFLILNRSGPGDAQMSSLFQAHLRGNDFAESPLEVAFGSKLTLKNYGYGGGLLHSHVQTYPVGSEQQQVTCYHYKDDNNHWVITPKWREDPVDPDGPIRYLQNGDVMRLVHASTGRNLHSHTIAAPVTKENWEVAGYGNITIGDENDHWQVEVVDDTHRSKRDAADGRIHSLTTRMRFRHTELNCYLRAANAVLPQWGFKQVEVSCTKENNPSDVHTYWNVESHWNERCTLRTRVVVSQTDPQCPRATQSCTAHPSGATSSTSTSPCGRRTTRSCRTQTRKTSSRRSRSIGPSSSAA